MIEHRCPRCGTPNERLRRAEAKLAQLEWVISHAVRKGEGCSVFFDPTGIMAEARRIREGRDGCA